MASFSKNIFLSWLDSANRSYMAIGGGGDGVDGDAEGATAVKGESRGRERGGGHSLRIDMVTKCHDLIF